jgi:integrase
MGVFKKNGSWWIDTYLNGERIRRKVGPDKRTAELAEKNLKVKAAQGEWLGIHRAKRVTFKAFCKEFLAKQAGKAEKTVLSYKVLSNCHLIPALGARHLSEIRPKQIEDLMQEKADTLAFSSVNLLLQRLKTILNTAVRWGYLKESPARNVKPLRVPEKEPLYLTREQVAKLYEHCDGWLRDMVVIGLNTGLRISEILALKWEDVDLAAGVIKIRSDAEFTTKSGRNREIPICGFLAREIRRIPRHITCPLVVHTTRATPVAKQHAWYEFKKAVKLAELPLDFTVHTLRHTFGTSLASNGVDIRTIQELMGHASITTTQKYLHAAPSRMQGAVDSLRLDGSLAPPEEGGMHRGGQDLVTGTTKAG